MSPRAAFAGPAGQRRPSPPRIHEPLTGLAAADARFPDEDAVTGVDLQPGVLAEGGTALDWEQGRATGVTMAGLAFRRCHLADLEFAGCDLSTTRFERSSFTRVALTDCRASALDLSGATLHDLVVAGGRAQHLNLRMAVTERLWFSGVDLHDLDAYGADLRGAGFDDCDLTGAQFATARCEGAVFRGCRLSGLRGVAALKGATVTGTDLWSVADLLAGALGITVTRD
jgi:uncharacterized protein YjbI with pentapeptide repeats